MQIIHYILPIVHYMVDTNFVNWKSNKKTTPFYLEKRALKSQLMKAYGSVQVLYKQVLPNSGPPTPPK